MRATDADDVDVEHALFAREGSAESGFTGGRSAGADQAVSRWFRQFVQSDRGAAGADCVVDERRARGVVRAGEAAAFTEQHAVEALPDDSLLFLLGSRYCETDLLSEFAWQTFGKMPLGRGRVDAICDYVHEHIVFGYDFARPTKTAWQAWQERKGVCRDFAHLAVTLCRAMNIPARYCTGYISDVGTPPPYATMDFAAWFEAYVGGCWQIFDPRNNVPRTGRVLMARGRDAADVAISNAFGATQLMKFDVVCEPV